MQFGHALVTVSACPERVNQTLHSIRHDVVVGVVVVSNPVVHATEREDERERQRSREGCVLTLESGETAGLRQIGTPDGESFRLLLRVLSLLFSAHIFLIEVLFPTFLRWVGLVGDTDETVDILAGEFVGELGFEFVNGAGTEQQREEVHRDRRASDLDAVAVGDFVAEPLGVALDRVPINLKPYWFWRIRLLALNGFSAA